MDEHQVALPRLKSRGVAQMYNPSLRLKGHNPKSTLSHENLNRGRYQNSRKCGFQDP